MVVSRTRKASLNIVTAAMLQIITIFSGIILPRYILQYFGSSYNGIISSATQFVSIISVLTIGVTASTRVALYKTLKDKDIKATSSIVRATEKYMRKVGVILIGYIVTLAVIYPIIINTGFKFWDVASLILIVGISAFAEYFFGITYQTFLLADQCTYISNVFSCIAILLNLVTSLILIIHGYSLQIVQLVSAIVFFLRPLLQNIYVTRKYCLDKHCEPDFSAFKKKKDAMVHAFSNIIHDNTDIIILTLFTNVKVVSVYVIYNMIMGALKKTQAIFTTSTEPIFGNMWALGENEKIKKNLGVFEYFVNSFNAIVFGIAMVMILPFISIYIPHNVNDINYIQPLYAVIISLAFATQGMRVPYLAVVQGVGRYRETRNAAVFEVIINFATSVVLVNIIGIAGVAIGTLIANVYRLFSYANYINKDIIMQNKKGFVFKFMWTMMNLAIIVVPSWTIVNNLLISEWTQWVLVSICVGIYACMVVFIASIIFYREDFKHALKIAKNMIGRKKFS